MEIIFATSNINKLNEVCEIIGKKYSIVSPTKYGITQDIPETGDTLESNALIKAQYIWDRTGINCFADDTGLEVESLNGAPGVRSARYAGEDNNSNNNIDKLLKELSDINNKRARFRTSISLIYKNSIHFFEGTLNGAIINTRRGHNGFGYDPVFVPDGYSKTLAELSTYEKNLISHRAIAIKKLATFLNNIQ